MIGCTEGADGMGLTAAAGLASPGVADAGSLWKKTRPITSTRPKPITKPSFASLAMASPPAEKITVLLCAPEPSPRCFKEKLELEDRPFALFHGQRRQS